MAGKITIPIVRNVTYVLGDRVEIEIDGAVQPDYVPMIDAVAAATIAGGGTPGALLHETLARFPAGDYSVRLRGVDAIGNVGDWMAPQTLEHRPLPETPAGLALSGGNLTGVWIDA
jgi:hypothetical protein